MDYEIFKQLGFAILLAGLIGLDREQKFQKKNSKGHGGLRTFTLMGLFGALSYMLVDISVYVFVALILGFIAMVVVSKLARVKSFGYTTAFASVLVYLVGVLCAMNEYILATVITLALFMILHFKKHLHSSVRRLENREIVSAVQLIVIAFVVLPLLPDKGYGPYEVLNPHLIWLMVVLISAISFASYVAIKIWGTKKGIGLTGFLAGLISSTALTLSFSSRSKKTPRIVNPYVFAVVIANVAMLVRMLIEIAVISPQLLPSVIIPISVVAIVGLGGAMYFWFKKEDSEGRKDIERKFLKVSNPLNLSTALKFGLFFGVILFLSKFLLDLYGDGGLYLAGIFSALVDVDAITISVANLVDGGLDMDLATSTLFLVAAANSLVKVGMFALFGNRKVALKIFYVFGLALLAGAVSLYFL